MEKTKKRNGFASGVGFILAAAGSAVGLGNLWSFPYKTSANGGAAFVLMYVISVLVIGTVVMTAEIYLGKRAQANPVTAYKKANKKLGWLGLFAVIIPLFILSGTSPRLKSFSRGRSAALYVIHERPAYMDEQIR